MLQTITTKVIPDLFAGLNKPNCDAWNETTESAVYLFLLKLLQENIFKFYLGCLQIIRYQQNSQIP